MQERGDQKHKSGWRRGLTYLPYLLLLATGIYLAHEFKGMSLKQLWTELGNRSLSSVLVACGLVCFNFLVFAGYDLISLRQIKVRLPPLVVIRTSALSFSVTNLLGHSMITGLGFRVREYGPRGLRLAQITGIVVQNVESWWAGFLFLTGIFFSLEGRLLGYFLLLVISAYVGASWYFAGRTVSFKKITLHLPDVSSAVLKILIASLDVGITGLTLYVLLPPPLAVPLSRFFLYYLSAQLGGTLSAVPAVLGVTEALMLEFFKPLHQPVALLATLLLYRLIHYIAPASITLMIELVRLVHRSVTKYNLRRFHEASQPTLQ
jgi:phosphatidylglycerol lysyltransferase